MERAVVFAPFGEEPAVGANRFADPGAGVSGDGAVVLADRAASLRVCVAGLLLKLERVVEGDLRCVLGCAAWLRFGDGPGVVEIPVAGRRAERKVRTVEPDREEERCITICEHFEPLDRTRNGLVVGVHEVVDFRDDVAIISDPDCGADEEILDPGFESAPNRWLGSRTSSNLETVTLELDQQNAHDGSTGMLALSYENLNADLAMETYVLVPPGDIDGDPAVTSYSRAPATVSTEVEWVLGRDESPRGKVKTDATWEQNEVCLPKLWAGRWYRLQVQVGSPDGLTGRERVLLDDFSVGLSPRCLAE